MCNYITSILCFLYQLSFLLEMRDLTGMGPNFDLIDRLNITVVRNVASYSGPSELLGDEGVATFLISHQLLCTNPSICDPTPTTPSESGKQKATLLAYKDQYYLHLSYI